MSKNDLRWPVGIIIVFGLFFLALLVFLLLALKSKDSLVERDYYRKGVDYQMQIDRIARAKTAEAKLSWQYSKTNDQLTIQYPASDVSGTILLYRPSNADADHNYKITSDDSARQYIALTDFRNGLWKLKINWQIEDMSYFFEDILIINKNN